MGPIANNVMNQNKNDKTTPLEEDSVNNFDLSPLDMSGRLLYTSSVGSRNLVTLIFTKTTFCQCGNIKRMAHILSNSPSSRPIRTPLKSIYSASKYRIYDRYHQFGAHFYRDTMFCHEKGAQNVITGWFVTHVKLLIMT